MAFLANNSVVINKRLDYVSSFGKPPRYILKGTAVSYIYENGEKTDKIEGISYKVVESRDYNKLSIKVKGQKEPIMSNELIETFKEEDKPIYVEFDELTVMAYINRNINAICDSYTASGIRVIED